MEGSRQIQFFWNDRWLACDLEEGNLTRCGESEVPVSLSTDRFADPLVPATTRPFPASSVTQSPWIVPDRAAFGLQTLAILLLLVPEPTLTKVAGVTLLASSAYITARGAYKIYDGELVAGGYTLFLGLTGGALGNAARLGKPALSLFWDGIPKGVRLTAGAIIVYPFLTEITYGYNQKIRSEVYAPLIVGSGAELLFPSMAGVNALDYYQIQIKQDRFRDQTSEALGRLLREQVALRSLLEGRLPECGGENAAVLMENPASGEWEPF